MNQGSRIRKAVWFLLSTGTFPAFLAFSLLGVMGYSGDGQYSVFRYLYDDYIEEGALAFSEALESGGAIEKAGAFIGSNDMGTGGTESDIVLPMIQDNSLVAYTPVEEDFIENLGGQRSSVAEYTVQDGDVISFIASDYGVSVSSIIWANNLRNADSIQLGQVLKIPPVTGVIHTVKSGDTIGSIAKKYDVEEDVILDFNELPKDGSIAIGDQIIVPEGVIQSTSVATSRLSVRRFSYLPNLGSFFSQPTIGFNWGRIHGRNAVDIANSCGTGIYAVADGTVTVADGVGWNGGFGKYVKISHSNGTATLYAHTSKLLVSSGQYVPRGTLIAYMGSTGRSTGCHLHFEVHGARNPLAKY